MLKKRKNLFFLIVFVCVAAAGVIIWRISATSQWNILFKDPPSGSARNIPLEEKRSSPPVGEERQDAKSPDEAGAKPMEQMPPSPPLPRVSPEASQAERREAFQLKNSVDFIVTKDEPFEAAGRMLTIGEILGIPQIGKDSSEIVPSVEEKEIGSRVRRPIQTSTAPAPSRQIAYYGVKVVKRTENVWDIHYSILREYFARKDVILPTDSDKPSLDGRSSGIGRILKFIEGVVYVYSINGNQLIKNIDLIQPGSFIVFFKISDLFAALDAIQPEDLSSIRYVNNYLRLERNEEKRDLVEHRALLE